MEESKKTYCHDHYTKGRQYEEVEQILKQLSRTAWR